MEYLIPLKNNKGQIVANSIVDEDNYELIKSMKWHLDNGYASGSVGRMHRFIINATKKDPIVDHINNNKLDNRKSNLRFSDRSKNAQNKKKKDGCSSIYIGVSYNDKLKNSWVCQINCIPTTFSFKDEKHAAYWYDHLALKHYDSNAKINGIEKPDDFIEPIEKVVRHYTKRIDPIKEKLLKENIIRNQDGIAIIKFNKKGTLEEILVDDDKYYDLVKYSWSYSNGYAKTTIDKKVVKMHRYVINAKEKELVDHINNNKLDNRLSNLRISNSTFNNHNISKSQNKSSKFIGISYVKKESKYKAVIRKDRKEYYLGAFKTEEDAAKAYNKKAIELYGSYANLNIFESV